MLAGGDFSDRVKIDVHLIQLNVGSLIGIRLELFDQLVRIGSVLENIPKFGILRLSNGEVLLEFRAYTVSFVFHGRGRLVYGFVARGKILKQKVLGHLLLPLYEELSDLCVQIPSELLAVVPDGAAVVEKLDYLVE